MGGQTNGHAHPHFGQVRGPIFTPLRREGSIAEGVPRRPSPHFGQRFAYLRNALSDLPLVNTTNVAMHNANDGMPTTAKATSPKTVVNGVDRKMRPATNADAMDNPKSTPRTVHGSTGRREDQYSRRAFSCRASQLRASAELAAPSVVAHATASSICRVHAGRGLSTRLVGKVKAVLHPVREVILRHPDHQAPLGSKATPARIRGIARDRSRCLATSTDESSQSSPEDRSGRQHNSD